MPLKVPPRDKVSRSGVDSRVDPYTFTFSQNSAGRVRLSSGCFPRQRRRRGAARAEGDSDVPEKAEALQEARPRREGRDRAGAGREPAGPRDGARPGEVPVERRRRGQAQPHRHARAGQGVEGRVGARGRLRQAPRLAARLQRLQQAPLPLLDAVGGCGFSAARAQLLADGELSAARRGVDRTEEEFESIAAKIQGRPGPRPVAGADRRRPLVRVRAAPSTIYRWIERGYAGMSNMDLRRKVGYRPRRRAAPAPTPHGPERSFSALSALPEGEREAACEMDTGASSGAPPTGSASSRSTCAAAARSCACFCPRGRRARWRPRSTCWRRPSGRGRSSACSGWSSPTTARSSRTGSPWRGRACRARGPAAESTTATCASPSRRGAASATTSSCRRAFLPKRRGISYRRPGGRRHGGRHVPAQLRAEALDGVHAPAAGAPGRLRRRRRRAHGRAGRRGGAATASCCSASRPSTAPGWRGGRIR